MLMIIHSFKEKLCNLFCGNTRNRILKGIHREGLHRILGRQTCKYTLTVLCDDTTHEVRKEHERKCLIVLKASGKRSQRGWGLRGELKDTCLADNEKAFQSEKADKCQGSDCKKPGHT